MTGTNHGLVAVNAVNGTVLWGNKFSSGNTANCPTPVYSEGYVFWANGYGQGGICMKLVKGGKAMQGWSTRDMRATTAATSSTRAISTATTRANGRAST